MDDLEQYALLYNDPKRDFKEFQKIRNKLRKSISDRFKGQAEYKTIDKKELIKKNIDPILVSDEERQLVHSFDQWTSYFTGFNENRLNMYVADCKSTAIGFRIIEQNLPKFLDNIRSWNRIRETVPDLFDGVNPELLDACGFTSLAEAFSLECFNRVLSQRGIEAYNSLIGGYFPEGKRKIQGLNELINLRCQASRIKLPRFIPLFKQILSDRLQEISLLPKQFESDGELLGTVASIWHTLESPVSDIFSKLVPLLQQGDTAHIYIANDVTLTAVMQQAYGNWNLFKEIWTESFQNEHPRKAKQSEEKYMENMEKAYKRNTSFSLAEIQSLLDTLPAESERPSLLRHFCALSVKGADGKPESLLKRISDRAAAVQNLLNTDYPASRKLVQDKESIALLKSFLDSLKDIQRFLKQLSGTGDEAEKDTAFYEELNEILAALDAVTPLYNKVRNYLTKKPYSLEKFKLNFECVSLLNGWDENKEKDNRCILLRKNGLFYIGIMPKDCKVDFSNVFGESSDSCYEKMIYKLLPGPNKMLPKVFFSDSRIEEFNPSQIVRDAYLRHRGGNDVYTQAEMDALIDFYRKSIQEHEDWKRFGFQISTTALHDLNLFYREIAQQGYKIDFQPIPESFIDELVDQGKLYLFTIWNKDFSAYSKGTANMHTLYWRALFDDRNLADVVFKLNGEAEIFYRKKSIEDCTVTHPANQPIPCRRNEKETRTFAYPLVKDRRFQYDQYSLHASLVINFKADKNSDINPAVRDFLRTAENVHVIGIDRGERNLIYISVIDEKGRIVEQCSLNEILSVSSKTDLQMKTDYHELLDSREKENGASGTFVGMRELKTE